MNKVVDVDVISVETACPVCGHEYIAVFADHELAQLRASAAEAHAAHVYLDESYINDPDDPPLELAERCARLVNTIAEQARQLDAAREIIKKYYDDSPGGEFDDTDKAALTWLAANPAPR